MFSPVFLRFSFVFLNLSFLLSVLETSEKKGRSKQKSAVETRNEVRLLLLVMSVLVSVSVFFVES